MIKSIVFNPWVFLTGGIQKIVQTILVAGVEDMQGVEAEEEEVVATLSV